MPEKLERFVGEQVGCGRYNSKSELLRDALRLKMVEREFGTRRIEGRIGEKLEDVLKDDVSRSER